MEEQEAPWSVEVPKSQLTFLLGPSGSTLKRLSTATGCELEVARQGKRKSKKISYGGQDQYLDDDAADDPSQLVKVFMRGCARKRLIAAEVLQAVAEGDDPEDHAARAEGALVIEHDLQNPDREAWARWRLLMAAHEHGCKAHLGRKTLRLTCKSGGRISVEAAGRLQAVVDGVIEEVEALVERKVDALDELEPEEAGSDAAVAPFIDQYGVMLRVCDQDDNAVCATITIRLFGPPLAVEDVAALLTARFIDGKATASVLQVPEEVQSMPSEFADDFSNDLQALESESEVKIHKGKTSLWVAGKDPENVAAAKKTLQEMLQFYLPNSFRLVSGLAPPVLERLFQDEDLGVLMARDDCVVTLDESDGSAWICGKQQAAVRSRIEEAARPPPTSDPGNEEPPTKRRRTSFLSFHSEAQ